MLVFDDAAHIYTWGGKPVPSVTQIIGEWQSINVYGVDYFCNVFDGTVLSAEMFRKAARIGTAVHYGCKLIGEKYQANPRRYELAELLDVSKLASSLHGPLNQFVAWLNEHQPKLSVIEKPMYSRKYGYAGTPDIICTLYRKLMVCDIKTGMYDMAGVQMAGYEQLYKEDSRRWNKMERYVLHLPKDGGAYRFLSVGAPGDWAFFQSRLYQHQHLKGRR